MIEAQPFNFPHAGELEPRATALIVIDLQRDFLSPDGYFARKGYDPARLRTILPNVNRLVACCRNAGICVVYTRQGYRADMADMTPYETWRRRRGGMEGTDVFLRGSPGFELVPELDVRAEDVIIDKTCNGSFTYTDLEHVLCARGITHLMFTGCTTDVCVHSSLREACDRNFQCLTISDACASGDSYAHEAALHMVTVEDGIFGVIADTDTVLAGLQRIDGPSA